MNELIIENPYIILTIGLIFIFYISYVIADASTEAMFPTPEPVNYYNADKETEHLRCTCSPDDYHIKMLCLISSRTKVGDS